MADCSARLALTPLRDTLPAHLARFADVEVKINAIILSLGGRTPDREGSLPRLDGIVVSQAPEPSESAPATADPLQPDAALLPEGDAAPSMASPQNAPPLEQMAERLARVEAQLAALPATQAAVDALMSRFGALEITHVEPIRQAAQAEVRQMMDAERAASETLAPSAIEQLRLDLLAAVKTQGEDAQRLQTILDSLGTSIEKVGHRLTAIEAGAGPDMRDRTAPIVAPSKAAPVLPTDRNLRGLFSLDTFGLRRRGRIAFA